ncbi:tRNA-splicing endonuclease subunit Sen2 isoform 1-T1 [Synchiropus picturatus]
MQAEFRAPRRRVRIYEEYRAPFPLDVEHGQNKPAEAELVHNHVLVYGEEHIHRLYSQGFFGKGILSRSKPEFCVFDQWEEHEGQLLPVVSPSRYEQLLKLGVSAQGLDEQAASDVLHERSEPVTEGDDRKEAGATNGADSRRKRSRLSNSLESQNLRPEGEPEPDRDQEVVRESNQEDRPGCTYNDEYEPSDPHPTFVLVASDSEVCVRRCPITLLDYLQLSLVEAFFLVYSLGCLSVSLHQEPLSVIQLWRRFRSLDKDFVCLYSVYHHFRSKGWVAKMGGGAKYGVDLMLYRKGPPFYHASYSVVVEKVDHMFTGSTMRSFSWRTLAALSRITANVSKELLLCYVIFPADLSEADLDSPMCLSRLKVQEVVISRWVSSKERAEQDDL